MLHVGPGPDMTEQCDHGEADTRIVIHVLHSLYEEAKTPEVSLACQVLVKCDCKRDCGNACSCKKK